MRWNWWQNWIETVIGWASLRCNHGRSSKSSSMEGKMKPGRGWAGWASSRVQSACTCQSPWLNFPSYMFRLLLNLRTVPVHVSTFVVSSAEHRAQWNWNWYQWGLKRFPKNLNQSLPPSQSAQTEIHLRTGESQWALLSTRAKVAPQESSDY